MSHVALTRAAIAVEGERPESDPDRLAVPDRGKSKVVVVLPRAGGGHVEQTFAGFPQEPSTR